MFTETIKVYQKSAASHARVANELRLSNPELRQAIKLNEYYSKLDYLEARYEIGVTVADQYYA